MRSEEEVLGFWDRKKIFEASVKKGRKPFVFFEGPPTANGKPGVHHVEARAFKDVVCRYKTMRGFRVERRAGWDTHGLPVEIEVEKKLGLTSKREIEKYGIAAFNAKCRESVWTYKDEWEQLTRRMGFWLDTDHPYVTYESSYIESLWHILKEFSRAGYLYEDDRIVPWCVRCGTALSSHELAQGYKTVTDQSVYVRFHLKERRAALLVWTTTPWTLPANVAAAVAPDLEYVTIDDRGEKFILLASRAEKLFPDLKPLWREKGENLIGLKYEPLYPRDGMPYRVVGGDFVSGEDGTGIVHIAPAFGDDDLQIARKVGLPVLDTIGDDGAFTDVVPQWQGKFAKDTDPLIIKDLDQKGFLWKQEPYEHEYPFCWRCDTPLLYRARKSWWIKVSRLRRELVAANETVSWHPEHLKTGRFGGWIREAKDWAISRERYWGTPLPIWKCEVCATHTVVGSIDELSRHTKNSGNTYMLMRHGFSKHNKLGIANSLPEEDVYNLTTRGKEEVKKTVQSLKKLKIDLIISSDLLRAKETAGIVAKALDVPVLYDHDLREIRFGEYEGKGVEELRAFESGWRDSDYLVKGYPGGESLNDVKVRMARFFARTEQLHRDKKILVIGHESPLWVLAAILSGNLDVDAFPRGNRLATAQVQKIKLATVPRNERGEFDLHRPYIDEIALYCTTCENRMARVESVADVWFDSGSMPYAAWHYPFENKEHIDKKNSFPADFIAEAIDQTRGWFYVLLAVSVLLRRGAPYKNVLSLGHLLDKTGKKMSKSRGNVVHPMKLFETYGADAVRWYFFTINQPGDPKLFDEKDVQSARRNFLDLLSNTLRFYELYAGEKPKKTAPHILDRWIQARFDEVATSVARAMDAYDIVGAARTIEDFVANDVSRWYVRRSRDRMKNGEGVATLKAILMKTAVISAPFIPFLSEVVYQAVGGKMSSVHLESWPAKTALSKKMLGSMAELREIATRGLELRGRAGIKIRQPLASLTLKQSSIKEKALLEILKDELNIKNVYIDKTIGEDAVLDIAITDELKQEGAAREIMRTLQDIRKKMNLEPKDYIDVEYRDAKNNPLPQKLWNSIKTGARIASLRIAGPKDAAIAVVDGVSIISVTKS